MKIKVTQDKFDEVFSIEDWLNFGQMTNGEMYAVMLQFVVDENDQPITIEEARKMFKKVPKKEWSSYIAEFMKAVNDAFVSPTNGGS